MIIQKKHNLILPDSFYIKVHTLVKIIIQHNEHSHKHRCGMNELTAQDRCLTGAFAMRFKKLVGNKPTF